MIFDARRPFLASCPRGLEAPTKPVPEKAKLRKATLVASSAEKPESKGFPSDFRVQPTLASFKWVHTLQQNPLIVLSRIRLRSSEYLALCRIDRGLGCKRD